MKRTSGTSSHVDPARHARPRAGTRHYALFAALVLLAATSASVAAADAGPGPLGVTAVTTRSGESARVGALFNAGKTGDLPDNHFCTASVVHGPNRNLILTAAHCMSDDTDLVFAPGYRDGKAPYGLWRVKRRFMPDNWSKDQDEDSDLAFGIIEPLGGKDIEDVVGGNRFVTGTATGATAVTLTGYPDSRDEPISCTNKPQRHSSTQQRIDCPEFTAGTSGSPWINGDGQVVGVLGGHEEGGLTPDTSYSVVLGPEAAELYKDAAADP
ncbi:trypsin-like peptidase domain-containing protein [Streptomyces sp. Li-HN-5-11]|uniref:trypsin-like serine peptidase n=1 Tax=Streptomyces sp. Li-HN-5-11 TaxID=3075432 RepID=UPI0028ACBC1B|nr:trypsin-like peptidase domain-containing protein [Streptomyces sp. Li-HN-5-11]WNM36177.1 trypsin-like peptidase domain-containing protein [Streptomyces sp. Li-HN-5-11]